MANNEETAQALCEAVRRAWRAGLILDTTEAGGRLGISRRRVLQLVRQGRLPAFRLGRDYIILACDLVKVEERPVGWPVGRPRRH